MTIPWMIALILLFLALEGFYTGAEIALLSADRLRLRHLAAKGSRGAQMALDMLKSPEWFITTILTGTDLAFVILTSLITLLTIEWLGEERAWVAILVAAPLTWIFGEIVPKNIFLQKADFLAPRIIYAIKATEILLFPIIFLFSALVHAVTFFLGGKERKNPLTLREEIDLVLQMATVEGDIQPVEKKMIHRLLNLGETTVHDIMVPLLQVRSVDRAATCGQAFNSADDHGHLILPVHAGRVDNIVGSLQVVDLLDLPVERPIKPFVQPVRYVPGSKSLSGLLGDFRADGDRLAIVVDEYGGCEGLVTLEDILERVVGEIRDEYDLATQSSGWWRAEAGGGYRINPRMPLVALRDELGIALPDGHYETLSGFLLDRFQEIPRVGMVWDHQGVRFTVTKAGRHTIREVLMQR